MISEKYRILMNKEIDGVCTPDESAELKQYLLRHPDADQHLKELKASLGLLDELPEMEPPAGLHNRIMRAVVKKKRTDRISWQEVVFGRLRLGYALSVVVGIMVGFSVHTMIPITSLSSVETPIKFFRGTNTTELKSNWVAAVPLELEINGIEGQVLSYQQDNRVLVRLTLQTDHKTAINFSFGNEGTIQGVNFTTNDGFTTTLSDEFLNIEGTGTCNCDFLLEGIVAPQLHFTLDSDNTEPVQKTIIWHQI